MKTFYKSHIFFSLFILTLIISHGFAYSVISERYSCFLLDENGEFERSEGLPIPCENTYYLPITIIPNQTAIIVMDPWVDMINNNFNVTYGKIIENKIIPLICRAVEAGHQIIILTNDPNAVKYNTKINCRLAEMVDNIQVHLLYHQNYTDKTFARWLKSHNIDTLIYTGFSSNQCIISRQMGMIMMRKHNFKIFFIPEASAAFETYYTTKNQSLHYAMTITISQWIGNLIHWNCLMEAISN